MKKIPGFDLAVNHSVGGVKNHFSGSTLLNHDYAHLFSFQSYDTIVSVEKNISPKFENILPLETCIPGVSPSRGRGLNSSVMF